MQNGGQGGFEQLFQSDFHAHGAKTDAFGCFADTQQTDARTGDETFFPQGLAGVGFAVEPGYHAEAGAAAVHGV